MADKRFMKKIIPLLFLVSCALKGESYLSQQDKVDISNGEKYPQCSHHYPIVFRKCVELNEKGQKVDAMRTEQLMKDGKAN